MKRTGVIEWKELKPKANKHLELRNKWQGTFCIMGQLVFYEASLIWNISRRREIEIVWKNSKYKVL